MVTRPGRTRLPHLISPVWVQGFVDETPTPGTYSFVDLKFHGIFRGLELEGEISRPLSLIGSTSSLRPRRAGIPCSDGVTQSVDVIKSFTVNPPRVGKSLEFILTTEFNLRLVGTTGWDKTGTEPLVVCPTCDFRTVK